MLATYCRLITNVKFQMEIRKINVEAHILLGMFPYVSADGQTTH